MKIYLLEIIELVLLLYLSKLFKTNILYIYFIHARLHIVCRIILKIDIKIVKK
jgi:hypothetical protein